MKKLEKLRLANIDKEKMNAKEMILLRGGETCYCTCSCVCACPCSGDPLSNKSTTTSSWEAMALEGNKNVENASGHGPY